MQIMAINQYLELFGNNSHNHVAFSYNNLEGIYYDQGKYKEGEEYYLKAVNIVKQIHEERAHSDVASSYNNLGNHYNFQAVEMLIKSLNLRLELYGKDNPHDHVSSSYNNLRGVCHH